MQMQRWCHMTTSSCYMQCFVHRHMKCAHTDSEENSVYLFKSAIKAALSQRERPNWAWSLRTKHFHLMSSHTSPPLLQLCVTRWPFDLCAAGKHSCKHSVLTCLIWTHGHAINHSRAHPHSLSHKLHTWIIWATERRQRRRRWRYK